MIPPIQIGARVVVGDNLQPYAKAIVSDLVFNSMEGRWAIILDWPNAPGGPGRSRVWDHDEGKTWRRYSDVDFGTN